MYIVCILRLLSFYDDIRHFTIRSQVGICSSLNVPHILGFECITITIILLCLYNYGVREIIIVILGECPGGGKGPAPPP